MRRPLVFVVIAALFCLTTSCDYQKLREVKAGREALVNELPKLDDFETITILRGASSMASCYYAEAKVVLGTALSEEKALNVYAEELESLGWVEETTRYEDLIILTRGAQDQISIYIGYASLTVQENEDYIRETHGAVSAGNIIH